jgi:hypothetical protein
MIWSGARCSVHSRLRLPIADSLGGSPGVVAGQKAGKDDGERVDVAVYFPMIAPFTGRS